MSKTSRLLEAMIDGNEYTAAQLAKSWRFGNPYSPIYQLRRRGLPVYGNKRKLSDGRVVTRYRLNVKELQAKV